MYTAVHKYLLHIVSFIYCTNTCGLKFFNVKATRRSFLNWNWRHSEVCETEQCQSSSATYAHMLVLASFLPSSNFLLHGILRYEKFVRQRETF